MSRGNEEFEDEQLAKLQMTRWEWVKLFWHYVIRGRGDNIVDALMMMRIRKHFPKAFSK